MSALAIVLLLATAPAPLPGAAPFDDALAKRLAEAQAAHASQEPPRTRHLDAQGRALYTNRLLLETSPYLLQHAHNPVSWYPWGDEAFEAARTLRRPVLLSVGYSTCHWCHVMEEESFEDLEIARLLNEGYVAIKVDREERPDVDGFYMAAVRAVTGGGGWPMTVWLTPDRTPLFAGTYFSPRDFTALLKKSREVYAANPTRAGESAAKLTRLIVEGTKAPRPRGALGPSVLQKARQRYAGMFDDQNGGLTGAPKFPADLPIRFLLREQRRTADPKALSMVARTLERMAAGGIRDHVGGGFHRYSTDARWLVPHFEKMLYDNARLAVAYLEAAQAAGRPDWTDVAREILEYVDREMTSPEGAFYSATDADSPTPAGRREEGAFFTWTRPELEAAVGAKAAKVASALYGVDDGEARLGERSVLHLAQRVDDVARRLGLSSEEVSTVVAEARTRLYAARKQRPAPARDEKILTAWNGLMISAYARAGLQLGEPRFVERAAAAASFLLTTARREGRLPRSTTNGRPQQTGYLPDYAFVIAGLLDLYEATGELRWLEESVALDAVLEARFEDAAGGFFLTANDHEALPARDKPREDGAEPSGNSVHALSLLRLHRLTGREPYALRAQHTLSAFSGDLDRAPETLSEMLLAVDYSLSAPREIVLIAPTARAELAPFLARLRTTFLPNRILVTAVEGDDLARQAKLVPVLQDKKARGGRATAYVCENRACKLPTSDPEVFARQLAGGTP